MRCLMLEFEKVAVTDQDAGVKERWANDVNAAIPCELRREPDDTWTVLIDGEIVGDDVVDRFTAGWFAASRLLEQMARAAALTNDDRESRARALVQLADLNQRFESQRILRGLEGLIERVVRRLPCPILRGRHTPVPETEHLAILGRMSDEELSDYLATAAGLLLQSAARSENEARREERVA